MTESNLNHMSSTGDKTSLYLYYDRNGLLLYVGITSRGISRNYEHNNAKEWWRFVARQEVEHYPTRRAALAAEKSTIQQMRPPFNVQHNPGHELTREAYLSLEARGELPDRSKVFQGLKWLPLEFIDFNGSRFLYATPQRYAPYVENLERDRYGFLCSLRAGKASISREGGILWVTIRGKNGRIGSPRLRVALAQNKKHTYQVKGIDLVGEDRAHPAALKWSAEQAAGRWS